MKFPEVELPIIGEQAGPDIDAVRAVASAAEAALLLTKTPRYREVVDGWIKARDSVLPSILDAARKGNQVDGAYRTGLYDCYTSLIEGPKRLEATLQAALRSLEHEEQVS